MAARFVRIRFFATFLVLAMASAPAAAAPHVLASIKPIHSLVAAAMEGVGAPGLIVGGAASEHGYALKPSDAAKIADANVVFWVGPDLESFLVTPIRSLAGRARIVTLENAPGVRRLPSRKGGLWGEDSDDGETDPHIWLDPRNAIAMTRAIAAELSRDDPANAKTYSANAAKSIAAIEKLDETIGKRLAPIRKRPYIVFHDGYHYFETHYGLDAVGAVTVAPDRPIGPRRIATLRGAILEGKAICVFREPQFEPALVNTLVEGSPARTDVLDPIGAELKPGPSLYAALLGNLADALADCLTPKTP